ncbi:Glucan 1,3-beta-glucosidase [Fusarium oxysporum f. sp. cepae]|uniref:Glucan 1,3-beta-glucosidase n=1 Tax=Fusarium oxysporum f. sp. cepae TaxID=396571 RepID=A0A3L6MT80_FUSOX|nr:Glucan 1,3-beta-glucosidase [Fusarium oxysporum f. sp. cepae]RKK21099.1 Glucan 1,3-beta-glucosidase [Fusarium oxysporum f. sp. cepae]RKK24171.1 Glucan 1,3-beta-glucosidase [Fusarium oxysporum f. sp. cepae]
MGLSTIFTAGLLAMRLFSLPTSAAPAYPMGDVNAYASLSHANSTYGNSSWWLATIERQGKVAYGGSADYKVFRNVKDYGAKGDGRTDDTEAINAAMADGNRCGHGCDSSTVAPALVYFPPGTYVVSKPILPYYYTHMVGNVNSLPVLKAAASFKGLAVIDANPYDDQGNNWHTNQNNFFRQIRNFKIDLTGMPKTSGAGIHWQVAQATSLQNIEFHMIEDQSEENVQQGIFIDNGSGGFMTDLTFIGGKYGAFMGSQQFTTRNMTFRNCKTAIYMNWNWAWAFHGLNIDGCGIGIDMTSGGNAQSVGSVLLLDSKISNTQVGVATVYNPDQAGTNGTLILDNVDMSSNVHIAVRNVGTNATILTGNTQIDSWIQGRTYVGGDGKAVQDAQSPIRKPAALLDSNGHVVTKSKPQYNNVPASKFVSVKAKGAKGDGTTDDTATVQAVFDSIAEDEIVYFDHGAYVITDTVKIPKNVKVVGEVWALIMAGGDKNFKDQANPKPVWQVGEEGDVGKVEMQDLMFETLGPQPGAILMQFNVAGETPGSAGLFDVHFRVGGSAGTKLQSDTCQKTPKVKTEPNPDCEGAFMLVHVTPQASIYMENTWLWVSDHELDLSDHSQINIYNGRGILIESTKGAWLWGTASEHNVLYNYQLTSAANVYMSLIQTETAYMQGNPDATVPFSANANFFDPDFSVTCTGDSQKCARTWGVRAMDSKDIFIYGGGLYSFFDNYDQECVPLNNCQNNIISLESSQVHLYGISTKASINMVTIDGQSAILDSDNRNNFCAAVALFSSQDGEVDDSPSPASPTQVWAQDTLNGGGLTVTLPTVM